MIPANVGEHLREHYGQFAHRIHPPVETARDLAAAEHVTGRRVAKPVVVRLGDELAFAVVAATDRVNLAVLEEATGLRPDLVPEVELGQRFPPCETGAEPALGLFGVPIFVDHALTREPWVLMAAGTRQDAVVLRTDEWLWCERAQPLLNLGARAVPAGRAAPSAWPS